MRQKHKNYNISNTFEKRKKNMQFFCFHRHPDFSTHYNSDKKLVQKSYLDGKIWVKKDPYEKENGDYQSTK